jgi:phage-related protein
MAFDGTDPCWIPRVPIRESPKWRLQIAQFGDGYQQRTLDGINALDRAFDLAWQSLPQSELLAMDSFLSALKGSAFDFQHPVTLVMWKVFCDEWTIDWETRRRPAGGTAEFYGTLSAQFVKANGMALVA